MKWLGVSSIVFFGLFLLLPVEGGGETGRQLLMSAAPAVRNGDWLAPVHFLLATGVYVAGWVLLVLLVILRLPKGWTLGGAITATCAAGAGVLFLAWLPGLGVSILDLRAGFWCWLAAPVVLAVGAWGVLRDRNREPVRGFDVLPAR